MGTQANYALRLPLSLKSGAEQVAREDATLAVTQSLFKARVRSELV
jgi:hypothetical protein